MLLRTDQRIKDERDPGIPIGGVAGDGDEMRRYGWTKVDSVGRGKIVAVV